ncbi:ankyrin repeat-containing domain protein [Aspergillus keveii]|uniref:Ankyrin repeat-containing domain protein n=1 Tax=Aspergillus keveii TaxID=714993 RepID=A0ABR4GEJ3_9EURO
MLTGSDTGESSHKIPRAGAPGQLLSLVLYMASNKLTGDFDASEVIRGIRRLAGPNALGISYQNQTPTVRASLETLLSGAVSDSNIRLVKELLNLGTPPDVRVKLNYGRHKMLLHVAVDNQHSEIGWLVLRAGAEPNGAASPFRVTPLQIAADRANHDLVRLLLSYEAYPNLISKSQSTALRLAVSKRRPDIDSLLLKAGADVNAPGGGRITVLQSTVIVDRLDLAEMLLGAGADVNALRRSPNGPETALHDAARLGRLGFVKTFLERAAIADDSRCWELPILAAAKSKSVAIVRRLLEYKYAGNAAEEAERYSIQTALYAAVHSGKIEGIEHLLARAASVNALTSAYTSRLLPEAARTSPLELIKRLLDAGCDVNASGTGRRDEAAI